MMTVTISIQTPELILAVFFFFWLVKLHLHLNLFLNQTLLPRVRIIRKGKLYTSSATIPTFQSIRLFQC